MDKTETFKKPKELKSKSIEQMRNEGLISKYDPKPFLRDKKQIRLALMECIVDGDIDSFKDILSAHLDVISKDKLSEKSNVSRRTLYRMLTKEGNPTLKNIINVFRALST